MWQLEIAATNACSGSTPGEWGAVSGMFARAAVPGTRMSSPKASQCPRSYVL